MDLIELLTLASGLARECSFAGEVVVSIAANRARVSHVIFTYGTHASDAVIPT